MINEWNKNFLPRNYYSFMELSLRKVVTIKNCPVDFMTEIIHYIVIKYLFLM